MASAIGERSEWKSGFSRKVALSFRLGGPFSPSFTKEGGRAEPPKGFSLITFEQNNLEASNVA